MKTLLHRFPAFLSVAYGTRSAERRGAGELRGLPGPHEHLPVPPGRGGPLGSIRNRRMSFSIWFQSRLFVTISMLHIRASDTFSSGLSELHGFINSKQISVFKLLTGG